MLISGYLACITAPDLFQPSYPLLALAVTAALLLRLQASYYKKYL